MSSSPEFVRRVYPLGAEVVFVDTGALLCSDSWHLMTATVAGVPRVSRSRRGGSTWVIPTEVPHLGAHGGVLQVWVDARNVVGITRAR